AFGGHGRTGQTRVNWRGVAGTFLEFFGARDHVVVPSASLVPAGDPTLLFTNAGMVQFKDVRVGRDGRAYARAATLQKSMRVQGKHNDLENVGPSPRHHTFFLMLGNFSFGDYFKREAIAYAWELVTRQYAIDPSRLIVTVHTSDDDAAAAWRAMEVPQTRGLRLGDPTKFWMMADVGPWGPPAADPRSYGSPAGSARRRLPRDGRPRPRHDVPDGRWRRARQRRPELRPADDHAAGDAIWTDRRPDPVVPGRAGQHRHRCHG